MAPRARASSRPRALRRALLATAIASAGAMGALAACATDDTNGSGGGSPGTDGAANDARGASDGSRPGEDSSDGDDAALDAGADRETKDANGPGEAGAECSFNRDCNAALRCECDEAAGCACAPGARGTGQLGVDTCDSGNQCASAVCVEGPGGVYYCSDECDASGDCKGALPVCSTIAFVGRICIRQSR